MTTESQVSKESAITTTETEEGTVQVVSKESPNKIQEETTALIDAIRSKALSEAKEAGELARDNYLDAVRRIRQDIEERKLFDPQRIDEAVKYIQKEVEKDGEGVVKEWNSVVKEVSSFGDRLNEAAKAAWEILTAPSKDKDS